MLDLALFGTFRRVAETGNFSVTARELRMTVSAVSRQIKRLEEALGVQLFSRTPRSLSLTEAGTRLYEHCARGLADLDLGVELVTRLGHQPQGLLRIASTPFFGRVHLMPAILLFSADYPRVSIDFSLRHLDAGFHESKVDILVRAGKMHGSDLQHEELAPMQHVICAAPDYLAHHGTPAHPKDLSRHNCLRSTHPPPRYEWPFMHGSHKEYVPVSGSFCADSVEALRTAALGGLGIARLPNYVVGPDIRAGRLVALFPGPDGSAAGSYDTSVNIMKAYYLKQDFPNRKIEAFVEFLKSHFGPGYDWERGGACDTP
jgi:DNA-binding transcriptional LysR family regulator